MARDVGRLRGAGLCGGGDAPDGSAELCWFEHRWLGSTVVKGLASLQLKLTDS